MRLGTPNSEQNFITIQSEFFSPPLHAHSIQSDSASFFGGTAKPSAPNFTISMSNDLSYKDVPYGGPRNKILHFDPIFPQKH